MIDAWTVALLACTALHAGFQLTVTLVVYPALADLQPDLWAVAHGRHSRRITALVALVYGAALVCCVAVLINAGANSTTQLAGMVIAIARYGSGHRGDGILRWTDPSSTRFRPRPSPDTQADQL